jgi:hypothetical protein
VTLAIGLVALRNTPLMLKTLMAGVGTAPSAHRRGVRMLQEDLEEERFFVAIRAYWAAPDGSPTRSCARPDRQLTTI